MRKHGIKNFKIETIEKNIPVSDLNAREKYWIEYYDTFNNGYNSTTGGDANYQITEEIREALRESSTGRRHTEETKKKISEALKGRKHSEESKKRMSESSKGRILKEETKKKISLSLKGEKNPFYGKSHTEETKKILSKKMSEREGPNKGKIDVGATSSKTVYQYNKNWELIREFPSITATLKYLGIKGHTQLYKAFRNKTLYKNYYWSKEHVETNENTN